MNTERSFVPSKLPTLRSRGVLPATLLSGQFPIRHRLDVISPEGCAAILWKDRAHAPDAAAALKMSAPAQVSA